MYRYFVSYVHADGFGNVDVEYEHPIRDMNDIGVVEERIWEMTGYVVRILYFQSFAEEE